MKHTKIIRELVDRYVLAISENAPELAPLADDALYGGPMVPESLYGAAAVRGYIRDIAPFIARIRQVRTIVEGNHAAAIVKIEGIRGRKLQGAMFFEFEDDLISSVQVFFDSRLLMRDLS